MELIDLWLNGLMIVLYLAAAVAYFAYFYTGGLPRVLTALGWTAWGAHSLLLLGRVYETGLPPVLSLSDALLSLTWLAVLLYLVVEIQTGMRIIGAFLMPTVFTLLAYSASLPRPDGTPPEVLRAVWVPAHVTTALFGYGAFALAFVGALMYLLQERQLRSKAFHLIYQRLPDLETLDRIAYRLVAVGFPLLSLAIVSGTIWAPEIWGGAWNLDAKVLWTMATWILYGAYLLARQWGGWRGRRAAWLAVAGFGAVLFNLLVVNQFLSSNHIF